MLRSVRSSVSVCKTSLSRCIHSNEEAATVGKVYELRTYNIWPQCFKAFLNLTSEEFHLRTAQSKLVGYWTSELGGLNEVVHIWEYDSLEHRAEVRATLAGNQEWIQRYFAKILPMMSSQQNSILSVIPDVTFTNSQDKGVYQLQTFNCSGNLPSELTQGSSGDDFLVSAFNTLHGDVNQKVLLWKHSSLTAALHFSTQQSSRGEFGKIRSGYSKIMSPYAVSPLQ